MEYISKLPSRLLLNTIFVPSGDQAGNSSALVLFVSLVCPLPSAFIEYISSLPSRSLMNTILLPSADQAAKLLLDSVLVNMVSPEPSGLIVKMAHLPALNRRNAIFPFCPGNAAFVERSSTPPISTSAREVRNRPRRNGERFIEFLVSEVLVFIKQTSLFLRRC